MGATHSHPFIRDANASGHDDVLHDVAMNILLIVKNQHYYTQPEQREKMAQILSQISCSEGMVRVAEAFVLNPLINESTYDVETFTAPSRPARVPKRIRTGNDMSTFIKEEIGKIGGTEVPVMQDTVGKKRGRDDEDDESDGMESDDAGANDSQRQPKKSRVGFDVNKSKGDTYPQEKKNPVIINVQIVQNNVIMNSNPLEASATMNAQTHRIIREMDLIKGAAAGEADEATDDAKASLCKKPDHVAVPIPPKEVEPKETSEKPEAQTNDDVAITVKETAEDKAKRVVSAWSKMKAAVGKLGGKASLAVLGGLMAGAAESFVSKLASQALTAKGTAAILMCMQSYLGVELPESVVSTCLQLLGVLAIDKTLSVTLSRIPVVQRIRGSMEKEGYMKLFRGGKLAGQVASLLVDLLPKFGVVKEQVAGTSPVWVQESVTNPTIEAMVDANAAMIAAKPEHVALIAYEPKYLAPNIAVRNNFAMAGSLASEVPIVDSYARLGSTAVVEPLAPTIVNKMMGSSGSKIMAAGAGAGVTFGSIVASRFASSDDPAGGTISGKVVDKFIDYAMPFSDKEISDARKELEKKEREREAKIKSEKNDDDYDPEEVNSSGIMG